MDKVLVFVAFLNVLAIVQPAPAPRISPLIPVQQVEDVKKGDLETASNFFSGFYSGYPYSSFPGGYYGFANAGSTPFTQPLNNKPELCILLNEAVTGKNSTTPNPNPPKLCIPITQNYFLRNANGNGNNNDGNNNNNNNNNNNLPVTSSINQFPNSINQLLANNNNFNNLNNNNNNNNNQNQNQNSQVLNSVNLNQLFPNGINQFLANNNLSPFLTNSQIRQL